jgi:Fe-Mn family superoxide dismutase
MTKAEAAKKACSVTPYVYQVRLDLRPTQLSGISEEQIAQHWMLYEGYVKNVNALNEKLSALSGKGDFGTEFAELKRRMGFEYDGMILHEKYFSVLRSGQKPLGEASELAKLMKASFGGSSEWREEFVAMGKMRGVGWVILYYDPRAGVLSNHWINLHEDGHPAGFAPILVMDVWEHAYMVDAGATGRAAYVEAFLKNVDWEKVEDILCHARASIKASESGESECNA